MRFHLVRLAACALACAVTLPLLVGGQTEDSFNTNQRILRIRQLGKRDATALPALTPYVKDENRDVRLEAVKAIVKIDTTGSLDLLVLATRDRDPEIRIRATDGIVNAYVPGYVTRNSLSGYFTRGVRQVRQFFSARNDQVVDADLVIRPDVAQALADEINDGFSLDARSNAALAVGILRDRLAVPALTQALHSKENDMIFESLVALQKIQDQSAGPHVGFLARDLDDRIQPVALETIGVLHSLPSAPDVRYALTNARNIRIRRASLSSLAMLGIPEDRAIFQQYASYHDPELRAAALEGLGRIREPEDSPALQSAFDEPSADWRIHLAAAFALANEGKVDTREFSPLPYLVETLNSNSRANIANAYLTELVKREDVRNNVAKLLPDTTKSQKIALCSIFGSSQSEDAMPVLNTLQKDTDPDVSFAASRAIRILQAHKPS
jgi:HEAT repeat protein